MKRTIITGMGGLLALALMLTISPLTLLAQEAETTTDTPSFSNPAQAAKAASLAEAAAEAADAASAKAQADLAAAEKSLADLQADPAASPEAIAAAEQSVAAAEAAAQAAAAKAASVSTADIGAMRAAGLGWGEIAHELGVHPGVLGLGHAKQTQAAVNTQAKTASLGTPQTQARTRARAAVGLTQRNTKTADPAEISTEAMTGSKAMGLAHAAGKSGSSSGKGSSKGNSSSKGGKGSGKGGGGGSGGSGGNGGGNGGGKGGGKS
jgi:hypothetical protein